MVFVNGAEFRLPEKKTVTMAPSADIQTVNGQPTRRWEGVTEGGVPVEFFVAFFRVSEEGHCKAFEKEFPMLGKRHASVENRGTPVPMYVPDSEWYGRFTALMGSLGACQPDDHEWVQAARWLLDNGPKPLD